MATEPTTFPEIEIPIPNVENLVTEDDAPMDNLYSEKAMRLLTEPLYASWQPEGGGPFMAMSNVGLFYVISKPPFVPDVLFSLGVDCPKDLWPKKNRSYFAWEYGKVPDVIIEIVSNKEGGEDTVKLAAFENIHVPYYVIFDPQQLLSNEQIRAYQLDGSKYRRMDEPLWFSGIELGLQLWQGSYEGHEDEWLRWRDARGQIIATGAEGKGIEQQRADAEQERADQEKQRADEEAERANRLAAKMRELGIDPDA
ncbi:MAG: hypothetical protein CMJ78_22925 [Planctomycetaceae bacterium]|nr:hypothetical protein [Planctomycetaceae bacterium]